MENNRKSAGSSRCFMALAAAVFWACLAAASGCQSINPLPGFGLGRATPEEARIRELMEWHSGRVEVYRDFRTVFTARAVYLSAEIQALAVDWEARSKLMSPEERAGFEKDFIGSGPPQTKVLVGFYTPDEELNNISSEDSPWIAYIKDSDQMPVRATCLDVDDNNARIYMRFLKWDLSWSKLYILCFPVSPDAFLSDDGDMALVITGPQGAGEISLKVSPPGEEQ